MTFLLRGEVEAHSLRSKYDQLEIKVDTLTKLLLPNNNNTNNNTTTNNIHNNLNGMGGPGFGFGVGMGTGTGGYINPNYSSISNYTPPLAVTGTGNGTGQHGPGGGYEFYPHSVSDLNSTYMSAYMSYIQADTPISGIKDLESHKNQQNGSDMKDMKGMAKSPFDSNLSDGSSQHRNNQTIDNNQPSSQNVPSTPLPLPLSQPLSTPLYRTTSVTTNINNNDGQTYNKTQSYTNTNTNTNTNSNKNNSAQNGESNHGSISGTSTSDWLFACTPHKTPITPNTTNGGQNPGVNAPNSNVSQISTLELTSTPIVKSEYNKVNSMIMCNGFTKESLGSVRYEYDSPSMISMAGNVPQSTDRSMSLQRRLFSQPSHFTLPAGGNETLNSSHPHPLLHPCSHPSSHPSHSSSNPSITATAHTQSHILPSSHTTIQNTAQFPSSTLIKDTVSVYDNNSQINGNVPVTPYNDIRGIITKNLAQSFLDVDASLTQIEKSRNGYSTYTSPKGNEYNVSEKENCEIHRNIPDDGTFFEGTRSQLPNSNYVSLHRVPQSPVLNSIPVDRYTASPATSGQRGSTGGYPLDIPPPPPTSTLDRHKIDGYTHSGKPNMHMSGSGDSSVKRDGTVHVPQGFNPPGPNPHSHYNPSPRKPSIPSFDILNAPSSSYSRSFASHHSLIQSPSPSPSPTLANRPSSQPIPPQRSSSSTSSTHRNTAVSSDNEQGSMCVPSCNVPLPSAPPNHPFSLKNIEIPLFRSLNSGTNKPVYDARHGSFSRK